MKLASNSRIADLPALTFHKALTPGVKTAVRKRLELLLEAEEASYKKWTENIMPKLIKTRQRDVDRNKRKIITALKIVVHTLTPYHERTFDEPHF